MKKLEEQNLVSQLWIPSVWEKFAAFFHIKESLNQTIHTCLFATMSYWFSMLPDNEVYQGFFKAQNCKVQSLSSKGTRASIKYIEASDFKNLQEHVWRLASHRQ